MSRVHTNADVADVLDRARAKMNDGGRHWIKKALRRNIAKDGAPEYGYCSVGAIQASTRLPHLRDAALDALSGGLPWRCSYHGSRASVMRWNDMPRTSWEVVERRFQRTAHRLRSTNPDAPL